MPITISYTSPLMNRHWQLVQTLETNLRCVSAFKGRVEWVIVNFRRSPDDAAFAESDALIRERGAELMAAGWLTYLTADFDHWNAGICKNVGGFCAHGDYIINLDIDNVISLKDTIRLLGMGDALLTTLYHGWDGRWKTGTCGMVGIPRTLWNTIGGYYEDRVGVGFEDFDLLIRAERESGFPTERFCNRKVIENTDDQRTGDAIASEESLQQQKNRNREHCMARINAGHIRCEPRRTRALDIRTADGIRCLF